MKILFIACVLNFCIAIAYAQTGANYLFPISDAAKQEIINAHIAARTAVGASDMLTLKWSDALARIWPDNNPNYCTFNHFADRSKYYTKYVGENLFVASGNNSFTTMVNSWVSEKPDYNYGQYPNICSSGKMCGHYTQIVWAKTDEVGCAYFDCRNGRGAWPYLFVCDYALGGNFVGNYPYTKGTCSDTTTTCSGVACGSIVNRCGVTLPCSNTCSASQQCSANTCTACPSQCGTKTCGTVWNSCFNGGSGGDEKCGVNNGGCSGTSVCQNNQCVAPTTCTPTRTSSFCDGTVCGAYDNGCNSSISCSCTTGYQCSFGKCVQNTPCGGACLTANFETCVNNACACQSGYTRNSMTGKCDPIPPASPSTNAGGLTHWESVIPTTIGNNWVVLPDGSALEMVGTPTTSVYRLRWDSSIGLTSEQKTIFRSDVQLQSDGVFSLAVREQSTGIVYSNWIFTIVGTVVQVAWSTGGSVQMDKTRTTGGAYSGWKVNDWNTIEVSMEDLPNYDAYYGKNYCWFSVKVNGVIATQYQYNGYPVSSFPETGSVFIETKQYAAYRNTYIITQSSLLCTFSGCMTQAQLDSLCASFSASSCSVEPSCKKRDQAATSVALLTFTSTDTASSKALATQFTQAAMAQDSRMIQYPSVTSIADGQSAAGANAPVDPSQAQVVESMAEPVAAPEAQNSGLSSGAIAGISIGSAIGALVLGALVVGVVAGAVVVGVKLRRSHLSSKIKQSPAKPTNNTRTQGPDLFDTDPSNKHASITVRSPPSEIV